MANKKINQLVAKTTIQSTDLFPLGDATTGQLFKKTIADLQAAIGGAVISVNGLTGALVLDTDDIQELASPTNRYFTEARARAAISLTTTGSSGASTYSSSTGVLNVPTYTLAGLGGITASFLSGGTGITYNSGTGVISYSGTVYTDASVRGLVSAGTGLSYNSSTGVFSYSGTVYTDSSIRALISLTTTGSSGAATYNNTTGVINVPNYTLAGLGGISLTSLSGSAPITYNSSTGAIGITQATTSTNGYLSATDWNTFNGKQSALTLGNVTESVSNVLMFPDGGTNKTIGNLSIQVVQAGSTSSGYLSTTDWNTFNNKQGAITLTTTGTSGAATFSGGTLNIPQYQAVLTNPVTGTGTTNYVTKWTSSSAIGNSSIQESGSAIGIGLTPNAWFTSNSSRAIEIGVLGNAIWSYGSGTNINTYITNNAYYDSVGFKYGQSTGKASAYQQNDGVHIFSSTNTTGTANGSLSLTQRMVITSAGYISINSALTSNGLVNIKQIGTARYGGINLYDESGNTFLGLGNTGSLCIIEANYNTGSYTPLAFYTGGSERMRIGSNGNIDFGGYNPIASNVTANYKQAFFGALSFMYRGAGDCYINTNHTYSSTGTNIASYTSNEGIGRLDAVGGYFQWGSNGGSVTAGNTYSLTARFICTVGGNFLIGTTTDNGERLYVGGSIRATGSITANSDVRLKKNIERIENALEKVEQISGYTYNTIYDEDRHAGVIAQEIDKVLPEIVNKGNDGLMGVEYGNISALLIEAIKDLKTQNDSLQARLSALEK